MGAISVKLSALVMSLLMLAVMIFVIVAAGFTDTAIAGGGGEVPLCEPDRQYDWGTDCRCPEGTTYTEIGNNEGEKAFVYGGGGNTGTGFICVTNSDDSSATDGGTVTGDSVPSLTGDTGSSVSGSAYSSSLPSTGLPLAVIFAGGLAAAGAGLVFAGRRSRG